MQLLVMFRPLAVTTSQHESGFMDHREDIDTSRMLQQSNSIGATTSSQLLQKRER